MDSIIGIVCACIIMYMEEYSDQKAGKQKDNESREFWDDSLFTNLFPSASIGFHPPTKCRPFPADVGHHKKYIGFVSFYIEFL